MPQSETEGSWPPPWVLPCVDCGAWGERRHHEFDVCWGYGGPKKWLDNLLGTR